MAARAAQPSLEIKVSRVEIGRIESSKRRVRENIDPEDLEIFAREIRQRHQTSHERCRGRNASSGCGHREDRLGKIPGRRRDLQFRLAGHHIDRRGKRAIRAVIGDLGREINRDAERHAQDIQGREQRMTPQVTKNVPAKNAKILRCHRDNLEDIPISRQSRIEFVQREPTPLVRSRRIRAGRTVKGRNKTEIPEPPLSSSAPSP